MSGERTETREAILRNTLDPNPARRDPDFAAKKKVREAELGEFHRVTDPALTAQGLVVNEQLHLALGGRD